MESTTLQTARMVEDAARIRAELVDMCAAPPSARDASWQTRALDGLGRAARLLGELRVARIRAVGTNPVAVAEAHLYLATETLGRALGLHGGSFGEP